MLGSDWLAYVKKKLIRTDKDAEVYEATTDIIADMRLQFKSEVYKEEAYIVGISTLGEYRIAVPTDFGHLIGEITCVDPDANSNRELRKISKAAYDIKYGDRLYDAAADMNTGEPQEFCVYGEQFFIGPVPDKVTYKYQINYTTEDYTEVTASTTNVPFTDNYRNILRDGVMFQIYDLLENYVEADRYRALYLDGLGKLINNDEANIMDNAPVSYNGV